jgi:hypothetical protein
MRSLMLTFAFVAGCSAMEPCDPGQKLEGNISCVPDVPPGSGGAPAGGAPGAGAPGGGTPIGGAPAGEAGADSSSNAAGSAGADSNDASSGGAD